jgi:hypothetical protein
VAGHVGLAGQTPHEGAAELRALMGVVGRQWPSLVPLARPGDGPAAVLGRFTAGSVHLLRPATFSVSPIVGGHLGEAGATKESAAGP